MPGRNDFAKVQAALLADVRAHEAARLYVRAGVAVQETALATVVGHVAMLGLWVSRETDDGILPGDGKAAFSAATLSIGRSPTVFLNALQTARLLRKVESGLYVCGFRDCYSSIIARRQKDAQRKAEQRVTASVGRPADIRGTSARRPGVEERRGEEIPPLPPAGGEDGPSDPEPQERAGKLRPRDRERFGRVLEYVIRCGTQADITRALDLRRRARTEGVPDGEIAVLLDRDFAWVTRERLARSG